MLHDSQLAKARTFYMNGIEAQSAELDVDFLRGWEDGGHLFLHAHQRPSDGGPSQVTTDFFATDDDGGFVEHVRVTSAFEGPNPSGRTQVDGATEITDLDRTEQNKAIVRSMIEDCLFPGARADRIEDYFGEVYLQHNPNIGDGLEIVRKLAQSTEPSITYTEIVHLVGRGNFVASLCKAKSKTATYAQVDIMRLENGKIVEHWDNYQRVA